jgi:hypothetical protein
MKLPGHGSRGLVIALVAKAAYGGATGAFPRFLPPSFALSSAIQSEGIPRDIEERIASLKVLPDDFPVVPYLDAGYRRMGLAKRFIGKRITIWQRIDRGEIRELRIRAETVAITLAHLHYLDRRLVGLVIGEGAPGRAIEIVILTTVQRPQKAEQANEAQCKSEWNQIE